MNDKNLELEKIYTLAIETNKREILRLLKNFIKKY